jgi:hypothetical protein
MLPSLFVGFPGAIHTPDTVRRTWKVAPSSAFTASLLDVVLMIAQEIADKGLADGVAVEAGMAAIEEIGVRAAAGCKEARRIIKNFFPDPIWFPTVMRGCGVGPVGAYASKAASRWVTPEPVSDFQAKPLDADCEERA